ncbi:MAG: hypothetical protein LBF58_08485 [Deltaproteobacteria bacterium]|nr:hypothetical protein [Deltaproteobacteria bacterium]
MTAPSLKTQASAQARAKARPWPLALALAALLAAALLPACASPPRYEDALLETQVKSAFPRRLLLTFERESNFSVLAHREVTVAVKPPATLLSPPSGTGRTDASGQLEIVVEPVAIYDRKAIKGGDLVVDYPVELTVSIVADSAVYEWDLDGHDSFARYSDPLYRGLDRDPDASALNLTLTVP